MARPTRRTAKGSSTSVQPVVLSRQAVTEGSTPSGTVPASSPNRLISRYSPVSSPSPASTGAAVVDHQCPPRRVPRKCARTAAQTRISTSTTAMTAMPENQ